MPTRRPSTVVIHDDAIGDFFAIPDIAIGQVEIDCVRSLIHSHAHGFVQSKLPSVRTRRITLR
jgi:hypothetical protein